MAHHPTRSTYTGVFISLLLLTALTVILSRLELGRFHMIVALAIATAKASLVFLFFMHLYYGQKLTWLFALAGIFWIGILIALSMSDYATRQDPTQERSQSVTMVSAFSES